MRALLATGLLCAALVAAHPASAGDVIASVAGEDLRAEDLVTGPGANAAAAQVRNWVLLRLLRDYVRRRGLGATPDEVSALNEYNREFERRDREQRTRKLAELGERLARDDLDPGMRRWLTEFRDVLSRMARREAQEDAQEAAEGGAAQPAVDYGPWVEYWKALPALYAEFGGPVAATEAGQVPFGAWAALAAESESAGELVIRDASLREAVFAALRRAPGAVVPPGHVDFTPYWQRPIPSSYFPDDATP